MLCSRDQLQFKTFFPSRIWFLLRTGLMKVWAVRGQGAVQLESAYFNSKPHVVWMSLIRVFLRWLKKSCSQVLEHIIKDVIWILMLPPKNQKFIKSFFHLRIVAVWSTWKNFCEVWLAHSVFLKDKNKLQLIFNTGQAWSFFYAVDGGGKSCSWFNYANSRVMPRKWSFLPVSVIPLHESKWRNEQAAGELSPRKANARNYSPREVL